MMTRPWPWYIAGPLIGLLVPILLVLGNRHFGMSANLRHMCAAIAPGQCEYFRYDWRKDGLWNLVLAAGVVVGGVVGGVLLANPEPVAISSQTKVALGALGIHDFTGLVPRELFSWRTLASVRGILIFVGGGFLIGFGTAYAGGCTSGHAISGLAARQLPSLIAVIGFFAGGLFATFVLLPLIL